MNYTELSAEIQSYMSTAESAFVARIPTFVRQAEQRIFRTVLLPELRKTTTVTATSGSPFVDRPADFLAVFSFALVQSGGQYAFLLERDPSFMREAYPDPAATGEPAYYGQYSGATASVPGQFILGPTPDAAYDLSLTYYYDPPSIVDDETSWLGDNADSVLLYASLVEAYTYLKGEPEVMQSYVTRYEAALAQLGGLARRSRDDTYRRM